MFTANIQDFYQNNPIIPFTFLVIFAKIITYCPKRAKEDKL